MKDKEKKLKMMRFWLVGAFAILFAAITLFGGYVFTAIGVFTSMSVSIFSSVQYWIFVVATAVLCVAAYYVYKWYLGKNG